MIRLTSILKEIVEGARVTLDGEKATAIQISQQPLDGEQLQTVDGLRKTDNYLVFYSLESNPEADNVKTAQNALKYQSNLIKDNELKELIQANLKGKIPALDYIAFLESKGELAKKLVDVIKELFPQAEVVEVQKMQYTNIDDAVDWEQFRKESKAIQNAIVKFLYKTAEKDPTYKVRKSDEVQSSIIQRLHSKYDLGLNPNIKNQKLPPIYDVFVECITQGKKLLIVDDNLHTGTDFIKIFKAVDGLLKKMTEETSAATTEEQKAMEDLKQIEQNPKLKTSTFLQDKHKQLKTIINDYNNRTLNVVKSYGKVRDNIYGYVLYRLKDEDISK